MKGANAYAFPFHYGQEAESYTFYRVPKILFTAEAFDHLSTDAKLLYGILLDRMQLSVKNSWIDEDGKVFIYYPRQNIMDGKRQIIGIYKKSTVCGSLQTVLFENSIESKVSG